MLDSDTKRRIDSARQILVGKVPDPKGQVEQITTALIYKFMDDMDKEAEELGGEAKFFTGEYGKYAWSRLMDVRLGGQARLNLYTEALENLWQNKNLPPLFRQIFKGAFLPYRDPETLNLFLKELSSFVYDHSERLGDAYEYLLNVLGTQGDAGQFRTPRHIIDFIVSAVNPTKDDTILDPACGTAGFLISAYKHILKNNQKKHPGDALTHAERTALMNHFTGYDISPDMVRLSLVNLYLHGFPLPNIVEYDTLGQEERWDDSFNVIFANPPFMTPKGGVMPHKRFSVQAKRSEVLFTDYIADHLTPNGRAGVIVPEGIIFQSGNVYKQLRKMLVENYLYAVVSLPAGSFNPYSGVKTSVLLMDKNITKRSREIAFVKVGNDGFDLGATKRPIEQNDLPQALEILKAWKEGKKSESPLAVYVEKAKIAESGDYNLSGDRYRVATDYSNAKWPMVKLGEVCEIIGGGTPSKTNGEYWKKGTIKWISAKHIQDDQVVGFELITEKAVSESATSLIKPNSVLLVTRVSVGKLTFTSDSYAINQDITGLWSKNAGVLNDRYLFQVLHGIVDRIAGDAQGIGVRGVTRSYVSNLAVPLPPPEVQQQIVEELDGYQKIITGARQVVENWKPRFEVEEEWERVRLGEVCDGFQYGTSQKSLDDGKIICLRMGNIQSGEIDWNDIKYATPDDDIEKYMLHDKDVLFNRTNSPDLVGKTGIFRGNRPAIFAGYLIRILYKKDRILGEYLNYNLNSITAKEFCLKNKTDGVSQSNINAKKIAQFEIPLPPLEIQKQIVEKIEAERALVEAAKKLIGIYEGKMKEGVGRVWGDNSLTKSK